MRASTILAVAASAVAVSAHYSNDTWTTTEVVTSYTTYCPYPTTIVQNNHTYTVTEATTLTITDCPCTLTQTYTTVTETHCPGGCDAPTDFPQAPHYPNVTVEHPVYPEPTHGADNVTTPHVPDYDGAANRATLAGGALAAIIGVAAYLL